VPPIKGLGKHKGADEAEEPLLSGSAGGKQAASDEPESGRKTPRDKFRELSTSTPREKPGAPSTDPGSAADPTAAALKRAGVDSEILQKSGRDLLNEMMAEAAPITKLPENKRMEAYIESLAKQAEGTQAAEAVGILKPCLVMTIRIFMACGPCMSCFWKWGNILYAWLPKNVTMMIFGATLCYFGGTFTASIAAYEAFRRMGFDRAQGDLDHIMTQIEKVKDANVLDDTKDDDGDGVADVQQVTPSELVRRKLVLIMKTIDEPDRINTAAASIWAASISVLATLAIEFAATTAMALGIVSMIRFPILRFATPVLIDTLGPDLKHWCPWIVDTATSLTLIYIAWEYKISVFAFYSALRGGRVFADALFAIIVENAKAGNNYCPIIGPDWDPNESVLDEVIGFLIASQGFIFQCTQDYELPFPINFLLFPFTIVENMIRAQVTNGAEDSLYRPVPIF